MFCPKCATQNNDGAKFCRSCGTDISLVPQAMTGQIPEAVVNDDRDSRRSRRERKRERPASVERGIKNLFMGFAFLLVALALSRTPAGWSWWYWMLIPAFSMMGGGVAEYLRSRNTQKELPQPGTTQSSTPRTQHVNELTPRNTNELVVPPPSVTEGTTRHLGSEGPTKVFVTADRPKEQG